MNIISGNQAAQLPFSTVRGHAYVNLTNEVALAWLQHNSSNRGFVRANFEFIKNQMIDGTWRDNGESIKFSYGKLIDGQHRLTAVAETGIPQIVSVQYGLDPEVQTTIDTGRKRTPRDVLSIEGLTPWESGVVGSGIHYLINYDSGLPVYNNTKHSNESVREYFVSHLSELSSSIKFVAGLPRKPSALPAATSFVLHVLFSRSDAAKANEFFEKLHQPVDVVPTSPIMVLHNRLLNDRLYGKKRTAYEKFGFVIKAWNIFRRGGAIKTDNGIRILNGSDFPEIK